MLYFKLNDKTDENIAVFDRFTLRASYGRVTDGFELTVMYNGTSSVLLTSIYDYDGPTTDLKHVVYDGAVFRYKDIIKMPHIDRSAVYPVINLEISQQLQLPRPPWKRINKLKRHTDKIDWLYKTYILQDAFREHFHPSEYGYMSVSHHRTGRIDPGASTLHFGNGVTGRDPYHGMKEGGAYQPPAVSHIELFFIVANDDKKRLGNKLFTYLKHGMSSIPGLRSFARIPLHYSENHVTFSIRDNPLPEIREQLQNRPFDPGVNYAAIYISPIHKNDPDPKKHRVYYLVKEELLKYGITSQVIHENSITNSNFGYFLPNISSAMTAKLGGIPWTLHQPAKKELVIGMGAYRPNTLRKRYLGSAFCFTNSGDFRGFNSFSEDDHIKLAGSFQKAIKRFHGENDGMKRLIIHFYKRMNLTESNLIRNVLKELNLEIPIVVLTILKTGSRDLVLTDRHKPHRLPLSGTWMRSDQNQFLLCNNTRFDDSNEKLKAYPFPIEVYIDTAVSPSETSADSSNIYSGSRNQVDKLNDSVWVEELLEQVYQFSRLNWRSVSIKDLPVTVAYPEMVAKKFPYFEGNVMPEFGKHNFWFL